MNPNMLCDPKETRVHGRWESRVIPTSLDPYTAPIIRQRYFRGKRYKGSFQISLEFGERVRAAACAAEENEEEEKENKMKQKKASIKKFIVVICVCRGERAHTVGSHDSCYVIMDHLWATDSKR